MKNTPYKHVTLNYKTCQMNLSLPLHDYGTRIINSHVVNILLKLPLACEHLIYTLQMRVNNQITKIHFSKHVC